MKLEFFNQDHEKIAVRVKAGNTESNFGLVRNDRHTYDSGPNALRFAWKVGNDQVTNDEFDACATGWTGGPTIVFGNPDGEAG